VRHQAETLVLDLDELRLTNLLMITLLGANIHLAAQNLIPNPGIENVVTCPTIASNIYDSQQWFTHYGSPDIFHSCGSGLQDVPTNNTGYQPTYGGNGYAGFFAHPSPEFIQCQLLDTLEAGATYEATFYVNLINKSQYSVDYIGMHFSAIDSFLTPWTGAHEFVPHIMCDIGTTLTDTLGWMQITGTYVATGNELYATIGRFGALSDITIEQTYPTSNWPLAYYLIDGINLTQIAFLPVELSAFEGWATKSTIELSWSTLTELNAEEFVVERSENGEDYQAIGSLQAHGNSLSEEHYSWTDNSPSLGTNYYRLVQLDADGEKHVSNTLAIDYYPSECLIMYPNPTSSTLRIDHCHPSAVLRIFSALGNLKQEVILNDSHTTFDLSFLDAGLYLVQLQSGPNTETQRLSIVR
jgi:hypothetical protein